MEQNRRLNIVIDYEIKCNDADVPYVEANIDEAIIIWGGRRSI